jgi:hypothetical protein
MMTVSQFVKFTRAIAGENIEGIGSELIIYVFVLFTSLILLGSNIDEDKNKESWISIPSNVSFSAC